MIFVITREKFERYVRVQAEGIYNMIDNAVQVEADLTREEHLDIIENYEKYEAEFNIHVEDF